MLDGKAIQRQAGLEMMTSPMIAAVMGPDEDLAVCVNDPITFTICDPCALRSRDGIAGLAEAAHERWRDDNPETDDGESEAPE